MEYENFKIDKWKPNIFFLILSMVLLIGVFIRIDSDLLGTILAGLAYLCFGWSFVFGKYKVA